MSLYRCAACGSPNVVTDIQSGRVGYNYVKGAVGTVVLGVGGAAAGIESKQQIVYICKDCGQCLTYPMPTEIKALIDVGVESEEARSHLKYNGVPIEWDYFRRTFKNIEIGYADSVISKKKEKIIETLDAVGNATIEEFNTAVDLIKEYFSRLGVECPNYDAKGKYYRSSFLYSHENPIPFSDFMLFQNAVNIFIENLWHFIKAPLPEQYRGLRFEHIDNYNNLPTIFITYLVGKMMQEYNYPSAFFSGRVFTELGGSKVSPDNNLFACYATNHPFVGEFATVYATNLLNMNNVSKKAEHIANYTKYSSARKICEIVFEHPLNSPLLVIVNTQCDTPEEMLKTMNIPVNKINITWAIPTYTIKDGKVGYCDALYRKTWHEEYRNREKYSTWLNVNGLGFDMKALIDNYFLYHQAERASFEEELANLEEAKAAAQKIEKNNSIICDNTKQIEELKKKIFGKAKALAQADELTKANAELTRSNEVLRKKADVSEDDITFYIQLLDKWNNLVSWHWVEMIAPEAITDDSKESAEEVKSDSDKTCEKSDSIANSLRQLKSLMDEGILTKEEFDTKKKQLLGL